MKIYVATYEDGSGYGYQKIFVDDLSAAKAWLKKQWERDFSGDETPFLDWCAYGAWTGKIKSFTIKR